MKLNNISNPAQCPVFQIPIEIAYTIAGVYSVLKSSKANNLISTKQLVHFE